ncbi:hypothetical protein [cf. Phormidesmis sp. LEGE 11477]|uniref:hypothetical protein n=1 Tax=cf. Phormidesmis sp. LEGE 11477 TaxID=1828680 RepID=UPI001882EB4A|nr:hypothetical protein [cf. Phormidesmis sp. LEGE 11477]MBE9063529.1 hypothetical protein [cf. Phormidesmis sp. LEGE 11477]
MKSRGEWAEVFVEPRSRVGARELWQSLPFLHYLILRKNAFTIFSKVAVPIAALLRTQHDLARLIGGETPTNR